MHIPTVLDEMTSPSTSLVSVTHRVRACLAALSVPERVIPLGLVLAVLAVFAVGLRNEFVQWDDYNNLVDNSHFRGLGWAQVRWMFPTTLMGHYIPLTWLTFGLDYVIWGMQPAGYHFTNLVLHAANAALFYWISRRVLTAAAPAAGETALRAGAAVAALFFAVHPLRAESVAWATERRDVLSGLLFLTCILTYLRAASAEAPRRRRLLALSLAAFALAMLAKSIVMTLPLLLLVLDWYPLRRLRPLRWSPQTLRVLLEKLPFVAVGVGGAAVSYWAVGHNEFFTPMTKYPLPSRIAMALYSTVFYVSKTVLPIDLSPLYELPLRVDPLDPQFLGAAIAVALVSVTLVALAGRWPAGLAAYAWYAIVLAPVGGLVHAGHQLAHDRYSYLSCLPFALLVGGGVVWLIGVHAEAALRRALDVKPAELAVFNNLGHALNEQGRFAEAIPYLRRALTLDEHNVVARANLGAALVGVGRLDEAITEVRRAADEEPFAEAPRIVFVRAYRKAGKMAEMQQQLTILRQLHPAMTRELAAKHGLW